MERGETERKREREREREREIERLDMKLKFINTCKSPIKTFQFVAVKQVYMLESLKRQLSHNITFYGRPSFHIHLRSFLTYSFDKSDFKGYSLIGLQEGMMEHVSVKKFTCPSW
jgi:hypothetical protein